MIEVVKIFKNIEPQRTQKAQIIKITFFFALFCVFRGKKLLSFPGTFILPATLSLMQAYGFDK